MTPRRFLRTLAGASALTVTAGLVAAGGGTAWADNPLAPKTTFDMVVDPATGAVAAPADGESIPNVDSVKSTIRAYYNASGGKANATSSRYITQVHQIENNLLKALPASHASNAAVVFDMDDTLLWNYNYEDGGSNFNYDSASNLAAVQAGFPAVPGMPALVRTLKARGYALYGITGRPATQQQLTLDNLAAAGFTSDGTTSGSSLFTALYTKGASSVDSTGTASLAGQSYVDCTADGTKGSCSTVEYKAFTRAHIEAGTDGTTGTSDDVDIVMNVGDQWSDLQGGYADDWTKIPNPTYFLSSPDIAGAPAADANMVLPTTYSMQPDGSSGYTVASGDDIPNIDPVRTEIRAYYAATGGVANKTSSNYISQLTSLESTWTPQVTADCTAKYGPYAAASAKQAKVAKKLTKAKKALKKTNRAGHKLVKQYKAATSKKEQRALLVKIEKLAKTAVEQKATVVKQRKKLGAIDVPAAPAVVFDADDTTLWNYDLEDSVLKFVYNATTAGTWISGQLFPAVPGMVNLVKSAKAAGCAVFGLTGRPASQQADTVANLAKDGFVDASGSPLFTSAQFYTKDTANQPWVDCGADRTCSTIEYKSGTRAHIEDSGFDIVGNFGDQYSDLIGGYADHVYKIPNPTYYLP